MDLNHLAVSSISLNISHPAATRAYLVDRVGNNGRPRLLFHRYGIDDARRACIQGEPSSAASHRFVEPIHHISSAVFRGLCLLLVDLGAFCVWWKHWWGVHIVRVPSHRHQVFTPTNISTNTSSRPVFTSCSERICKHFNHIPTAKHLPIAAATISIIPQRAVPRTQDQYDEQQYHCKCNQHAANG
jgi:hypothetical protein